MEREEEGEGDGVGEETGEGEEVMCGGGKERGKK